MHFSVFKRWLSRDENTLGLGAGEITPFSKYNYTIVWVESLFHTVVMISILFIMKHWVSLYFSFLHNVVFSELNKHSGFFIINSIQHYANCPTLPRMLRHILHRIFAETSSTSFSQLQLCLHGVTSPCGHIPLPSWIFLVWGISVQENSELVRSSLMILLAVWTESSTFLMLCRGLSGEEENMSSQMVLTLFVVKHPKLPIIKTLFYHLYEKSVFRHLPGLEGNFKM